MNFEEYSQDFLSTMKHRWTASTYVSYADRLKAAYPHIGELELSEIKPRTLHVLAGKLYDTEVHSSKEKPDVDRRKLGSRRVRSIMSIVVSVLNDAFENDEGPTKAFSWEAVKKQEKTAINPLSPDDAKKIINKVHAHYQPIFWFMYCTGCRPSEALALKWSDLDLASPKPTVTFSRARVRGVEGGTKTKQTRTIALNRKARNVLAALTPGAPDDSVFVGKRGEPINGHLDRIWRDAEKKVNKEAESRDEAGIKHRPSYRLRHSFGSAALYNGVAVPVVSKIMGHSSIKTTLRYYADTIEGMPDEADKIEDMFA